MTRPWPELVAAGKQAVKAIGLSKWILGDLACEVAPVGKPGVRTGVEDKLEEFADEIGIDSDDLDGYRFVANAWPASTRVEADRAAWTVFRELQHEDDRVELIKSRPHWTVREARELVAERRNARVSAAIARMNSGTGARSRANFGRGGGQHIAGPVGLTAAWRDDTAPDPDFDLLHRALERIANGVAAVPFTERSSEMLNQWVEKMTEAERTLTAMRGDISAELHERELSP